MTADQNTNVLGSIHPSVPAASGPSVPAGAASGRLGFAAAIPGPVPDPDGYSFIGSPDSIVLDCSLALCWRPEREVQLPGSTARAPAITGPAEVSGARYPTAPRPDADWTDRRCNEETTRMPRCIADHGFRAWERAVCETSRRWAKGARKGAAPGNEPPLLTCHFLVCLYHRPFPLLSRRS
jgi:hypothetical protein